MHLTVGVEVRIITAQPDDEGRILARSNRRKVVGAMQGLDVLVRARACARRVRIGVADAGRTFWACGPRRGCGNCGTPSDAPTVTARSTNCIAS